MTLSGIWQIYDQWVAPRFDQDPFGIYGESREIALQQIREGLTYPPQRILDIGMGTGTLLSSLHRIFPSADLFGLEVSQKMAEVAKAKFSEHGIDQVKIVSAGVEHLEKLFEPQELDLVTMHYVLGYVDTRRTLRDIRKVLEPGAFLSLASSTRESFPMLYGLAKNFVSEDFLEQQVFVPGNLQDLKEELHRAGFKVLGVQPFRKRLVFEDYDHLKDFILYSGWMAHPLVRELDEEQEGVYREFSQGLFPLEEWFVSAVVLAQSPNG